MRCCEVAVTALHLCAGGSTPSPLQHLAAAHEHRILVRHGLLVLSDPLNARRIRRELPDNCCLRVYCSLQGSASSHINAIGSTVRRPGLIRPVQTARARLFRSCGRGASHSWRTRRCPKIALADPSRRSVAPLARVRDSGHSSQSSERGADLAHIVSNEV